MPTIKTSSMSRVASNAWTGDVVLLLVALVWGSSYITAKTVLQQYDPFMFLFYRFFLTTLIMLPFTWKYLKHASKETWSTGIIFGVFLFSIFSFETWGIHFTSAANSAFIISLTLILTPLMDWVVNKKFMGYAFFFAVFLSIIGTGLLTFKDTLSFNLGDTLILVAAFLRASQMTYTKKLTDGKTLDSSALTVIQLGVVAILSGLFNVTTEGATLTTIPLSVEFWLLTLYLALFCTVFAFYAQMVFIRKTSPSRVGLLMGTEPVFGALFPIMFGGEILSGINWIGGLCILGATFWGRQLLDR
ncbi:DMT family transporter [Ectobacillus sp. sgz5001026]|uniref:DMT family transporter n=1 Tax=Ectobacillus sp. sgz5001026 TaxID=3242473 RepID=UPI0036D3CBDC